MQNVKIFTGNANKELASKIARELGLKLSPSEVTKFSDGEIRVELLESVRGKHVYVVQPTSAPANDNLMELLLIVDAARRAGAKKISAVVSYYGYSRQDRRPDNARAPLSSRVVADMIEAVGVNEIFVVDMHSLQQIGFFKIPVINVSAMVELSADIWKTYGRENPVIISPDVGGTARARSVAKELGFDLAIIDKRRKKANVSEIMNVIGEVKDRTCVIVDDMIDTGGTLCKASKALKERGANKVSAYITHAVLSGDASKNLVKYSKFLDELVVTDTISLDVLKFSDYGKIRIVSTAKLISEILRLVKNKKSIVEHLP